VDSPQGYPQTPPYKWWNWHDNYDAKASPDPKWVDIITAPEGAASRRRDAEAKGYQSQQGREPYEKHHE